MSRCPFCERETECDWSREDEEMDELKQELTEKEEELASAKAERLAALTHSQVVEGENLRLIGENRKLTEQLDNALRLGSEAMGEVKLLRARLAEVVAECNLQTEVEDGLSQDLHYSNEERARQAREIEKLKAEIQRLGELVLERHDGRGE